MITTRSSGVSDPNQHNYEDGLIALDHISGILKYASKYKDFLKDADQYLGHCMRQDEKVEELKSQLEAMRFFATSEVEKLCEKNARYEKKHEQLRKNRRELDDSMANMQRDLQKERSRLEDEAAEAQNKQNEKLQLALLNNNKKFESRLQKKTEKANEKHKIQISEIQSEIEQLKDSERTLNKEIESLKCDHRSSRTRVLQIEAKLEKIRPLAPIAPKTAGF